MTYNEYIKDRIETEYKGVPYIMRGRCQHEVEAMKEAFPELEIVKGHVTAWWPNIVRKEAHWWLTDPDGNVVDPTVGQFFGVSNYEPYEEGDDIRLGKCMNCGEEIWGPPDKGQQCVCSDSCGKILAQMNNGSSS